MSTRCERLLQRMDARGDDEALVADGESVSFRDLAARREGWLGVLDAHGIRAGEVVGLKARHAADAVSLLLALASRRCVAASWTGCDLEARWSCGCCGRARPCNWSWTWPSDPLGRRSSRLHARLLRRAAARRTV